MNYSREAVEKGGPPERRLRTADADQKTTEKLEKTCGGICTLRFNIINFSQKSEIRNPKSKIVAETYLTVRRRGRGPRTPGRTAISEVAAGDS